MNSSCIVRLAVRGVAGRSADVPSLLADGEDVLPAWLASQTLPMFPVDSLSTGCLSVRSSLLVPILKLTPSQPLLSLLSYAFSSSFSHGQLFSHLSSDLSTTPAGKLHWNVPSPSHTLLTNLSTSPLFLALGPLSRSIGRCIEACGENGSPASITAVRSCMDGAERVVGRVKGWEAAKWSDAKEDDLDEETRVITLPWAALKSLLFALTLVQSSLLTLLTPKHGAKPTRLQLLLAGQALRNLGATYYITLEFGTEGFGAWKGVWSGLLEVLSHDDEGIEGLMRQLEPREIGEQALSRAWLGRH